MAKLKKSLETPSGEPRPRRSRQRWLTLIVMGFFGLIILGGAGFVTASTLEDHDTFCTTCHTAPEVAYYDRAHNALANQQAPIVDLATVHYTLAQTAGRPEFTCINCHRGDASLSQRVSTIALGGRDAVIFVLGRADPTLEKTNLAESWLPNAACISCHADTLLTLKGRDNHWHNNLPITATLIASGAQLIVPPELANQKAQLLRNGIQTISTSIACTDCHQAHVTIVNGQPSLFTDQDRMMPVCQTCHDAAPDQ
jgi:hypothetical protein